MVNKKKILSLFLCFGVIALSGCVKTPDLTEEEQDLIAEYSAGVLLKHEDSYERKLISEAKEVAPVATPMVVITPTPTPVPESKDDTTSEAEGEEEEEEALQQVSLNDMYGLKGITVSYDSYVLSREYPRKESAFQMTAKKGEQFFVARFNVKNTTGGKKKVNVQRRNLAYPLILNDEEYQPTIVLQKNGGLNYLKTTLKANSSEEAILVYNIPTSVKKISSAVLTVRDEKAKKESTITCK